MPLWPGYINNVMVNLTCFAVYLSVTIHKGLQSLALFTNLAVRVLTGSGQIPCGWLWRALLDAIRQTGQSAIYESIIVIVHM